MSTSSIILVVDDDAAVRDVTRAMLEAIGYTVVAAEHGAAALALIDAGETIDLALVDMSMPDMNGAALTREILIRRAGLPVLMATGYGASLDDSARIGLAGVLEKPFGLQALRDSVDGALAARTHQGPEDVPDRQGPRD